MPKSTPAIADVVSQRYDSYTIVNPVNTATCAVISITSGCGTNIFYAAYLGSFDPANIQSNYLGDPGASFSGTATFSVNIPANGSIVLVIHEVSATGCANYSVQVQLPVNAPSVTVTESTCQPGCTLGGGSFHITPCDGSTLTFYDDANGTNPTTTVPVYNQSVPMTIYYACVNAAGCRGDIQSLTTVPGTCVVPTITLTSAAGTDAQILCVNNPINNITYSTAGVNSLSVSGLPVGSNVSWLSNLLTISSTPTTAGQYSYTISLQGGCNPASATGTITVNPIPDAVATPASQTVCSKANIATIVLSGAVTGTSFDWTRDNPGILGIPTSGTGNISGALTNNGTVPVTVTFTITPRANNCYGTPITATVTVNPLTYISGSTVSQVISALNNTSFSVTATGTPPVSYQWQVSTDGGTSFTNLADGGVYSGTATSLLTLTAVPASMSGYKFRCVVTGGCSVATSSAASLTVNRRPTVLTYTGDNAEQYSDQQTLTATLRDQLTNTPLAGKTVNFTIGVQSAADGPAAPGFGTDASGNAMAYLKLHQNPGSYTVASAFAGDANYLPSSDSDPFTITRENAIVDYTGPEFISVPCASCATTTILLSASIRDTTAVYPLNDPLPGDIRKARVKFYNINTSADISGWLTPGLVNAADSLRGLVTYSWTVPIPNTGYDVYSVGVKVEGPSATVGNYIGKAETVINVSRGSLTDFITGGGNIVPNASNGQYASDAGKKVNFGFNVKFNRNGSNPKGNMNIIFRRAGRIYQIKSTAITSLSLNAANPCSKKASFISKANLQDITNPFAITSVYGGITLQVTMTDNGEPGANDKIGITLLNGNNLVYSSNWSGTQTTELTLTGGNIVVHSGANCTTPYVKGGEPDQKNIMSPESSDLEVLAYPNPSSTLFNIQVKSADSRPISVRLMDITGKNLETFSIIDKGSAIKVGANLRSGTYFAEVIQGEKRKVVKLVKAN